jgi:hypothetical protein
MRIEDGTLYITKTDFDHIMGWSDHPVPSEAFKEGFWEETYLNGIEDKPYDMIVLDFDVGGISRREGFR